MMASETSNDLISREEVIVILENMIFESGKNLSKVYLLMDAKERIERLNTVSVTVGIFPEQQQGNLPYC